MLEVKKTNLFKKDFKLALRQGKKEAKFIEVLEFLISDISLPFHYRPHKLLGSYTGFWECHIEPDWLLIYEYSEDGYLVLRRTGSHSHLFE